MVRYKRRREKTQERGRNEAKTRRKREILDSGYYPPESMDVSNYEEQPSTLVSNLVPTPEESRDTQQDKSDNKTEEDRRVIMQLLDDERDIDYYSNSDSDLECEYQSFMYIKC